MQGRPQAIEKMTVADSITLLHTGRLESDKFKTRRTHRIQMITVEDSSHTLLKLYMDTIRPLVLLQNNIIVSPKTCILNYDGVHPASICRRLIEFYEKHCGMHITTTTIRSLLETRFHHMFEEGK